MTAEIHYRIGSQWVTGTEGDVRQNTSPADTREVLATYRHLSSEQVADAMQAAVDAQAQWGKQSAIARAAVLSKAARLLRERQLDYARMVSLENGKTLAEATIEVEKSADFLDFYAATARMPSGGMIADARPGTRALAKLEPVGVVAMITPWNDPMLTPARKLGPALVSGNAVVLKPASDTPLAADMLVRALVDAGLPAGVVNTVLCSHNAFEEQVLAHPKIAAVTFTGSTQVGLHLSRLLAGRNIRLQTEMGGKNASVVMADADLDLVVATLIGGAFGQAGQRCTATSRLLVAKEVHDELVEKLSAAVGALKIGHSLEDGTQSGPAVSRRQQQEVLSHIERARAEGGNIVLGGGAADEGDLAHGCFVKPTIVTGVSDEHSLWKDEVFGPVLAVRAIESYEEAVAAVNDSEYGLSAAIFTRSLEWAQRFIDDADTGQVSVNLPTSGWDVHQPFGGFKDSGSPFKEQGVEGLRFYTRTKMVAEKFVW